MEWPDHEHEFIARKHVGEPRTADDMRTEDWLSVAILLERSTALLDVDPEGALRVAAVEAIDRQGIGECVDLMSYGWGWIQVREVDRNEPAADAVRTSLSGLTDHVRIDLEKTLDSVSHWCDGPEFFVLLCSADLPVGAKLLHPFRDHGELEDAHWRDPRAVVPSEGDPPDFRALYNSHADRKEADRDGPDDDELEDDEQAYDDPYTTGTIGPGGRYDACFVIGVIGGEPSPQLRQLAELSGGVVAPIRDAVEAATFGELCRERYLAVLGAVERRCDTVRANLEEYREMDEAFRDFRQQLEAQQELRDDPWDGEF